MAGTNPLQAGLLTSHALRPEAHRRDPSSAALSTRRLMLPKSTARPYPCGFLKVHGSAPFLRDNANAVYEKMFLTQQTLLTGDEA